MSPSSSTSSSSALEVLLLKGAIFLALLLFCDRLGGWVAEHLYFATRDGDTGGQINSLLDDHRDVLVFGDSRAESQYVPDILRTTLGMSAFNAGFKGSNTLYQYGLEQLTFDHYTPKVIIYDFSPYSIFKSGLNPHLKLAPLYPFWRNAHVWSLIAEGGLLGRLCFLSRLYPYNSKIHSIIIFSLMKQRPHVSDGYVGRSMGLKDDAIQEVRFRGHNYDEMLVDYLDKFFLAAHTHGVKVFVTVSPRHEHGTFEIPERIRRRLSDFGIPVIDFDLASHPEFADGRLFHDPEHLDDQGARLYSKLVGDEISVRMAGKSSQPGGASSVLRASGQTALDPMTASKAN